MSVAVSLYFFFLSSTGGWERQRRPLVRLQIGRSDLGGREGQDSFLMFITFLTGSLKLFKFHLSSSLDRDFFIFFVFYKLPVAGGRPFYFSLYSLSISWVSFPSLYAWRVRCDALWSSFSFVSTYLPIYLPIYLAEIHIYTYLLKARVTRTVVSLSRPN